MRNNRRLSAPYRHLLEQRSRRGLRSEPSHTLFCPREKETDAQPTHAWTCRRWPGMDMSTDQRVADVVPGGGRGRLAQVIAARGGKAAPEALFVIERREALIYIDTGMQP